MKRWFLTVDWCNKGERGIFASKDGNVFGKDTKHTEDEMSDILGVFELILNPVSIELTIEQLKEYHLFTPLAEYSNQYGIVRK